MKTHIRHFFMIVMITGLVSTQAFGQDKQITDKTAEEMAKASTERQKERLNLSDQQEQQMHKINLKYLQEMQEIRKEGRSVSTMKKLMNMSDRMDKEVVVILDKKQYNAYLKMKDERRQEMIKQMRAQRGNG